MMKFKTDVESFEKEIGTEDIASIIDILKDKIKDNTKKYFETDNLQLQEILKLDLIKYYNLMFYYQAKLNGLNRAYILDDDIEKLPNIYMVEQVPERFEIDNQILGEINVTDGLTTEQAIELLKWTVNNTRDNLIIESMNSGNKKEDVYGNSSLMGTCGFSQFSTLYPLQKLGLEVTINNVGDVCDTRHAYGTVLIPIKKDGKVIKERFLIDCTYRQFFTLPYNVAARYLSHSPFVGFFVSQDEEQIEFSKQLLKNGFVVASLENMEKYLKPFVYGSSHIDNIYNVEEKFNDVDIFETLDRKQEEFDYDEEEFVSWGLNLDLVLQKNRTL